MHLAEVLVGDVAGVDARPEAAHQPRAGGLSEDRRADRVDSHQRQIRIELPQHAGDARGVAAGADAAHQHVDVAQLGGQFEGERGVRGGVVRVVVLEMCIRDRHVDPGAVRGQKPGHGRLEARVGDQGDRVAVDQARQSQPEAQGSAGGLDDPRTGLQVAAGVGPFDHVQSGTVLDAAGVEALQLRPEASARRRERFGDAQERGVAHQFRQGRAACGRRVGGRRMHDCAFVRSVRVSAVLVQVACRDEGMSRAEPRP